MDEYLRSYDHTAFYPQFQWRDETRLERQCRGKFQYYRSQIERIRPKPHRFLTAIADLEELKSDVSEDEITRALRNSRKELREAIYSNEVNAPIVYESFANLRELCRRVLDQRPFDVQLIGAWTLLAGRISEMQTGEGKSLTAAFAASLAALAGYRVQIITVNEYLADRDASAFEPLFSSLGLDVGLVLEDSDLNSRYNEYRKPIVYGTNKLVAFDFLRDCITTGSYRSRTDYLLQSLTGRASGTVYPLLPGLNFAIIDEIDSVLIDEARTPLIISGSDENQEIQSICRKAFEIVQNFEVDREYKIDFDHRLIVWTDAGRECISVLSADLGGLWSGPLRTREFLTKALSAKHFYENGKDYVVYDGKVQIIDEYTGRRMPDRSWEGGLHQLIELKEMVDVTPPRTTLASVTFQHFFRRYWRVAGMSGTVKEVAEEMYGFYNLPIDVIPPNKPSKRIVFAPRVFATYTEKEAHVLAQIRELNKQTRPVLVGTRSVAASERLSAVLREWGIAHEVLNAMEDKPEADIVANAGKLSQVTVATNMAGRGTDIKLSNDVRKLGGLHVIATEIHDSKRIDRQLFGRCARQGDPGSCELVCSLDDELLVHYLSKREQSIARWFAKSGTRWRQTLAFYFVKRAQRRAESINYLTRQDLLQMNEEFNKSLSFAGRNSS